MKSTSAALAVTAALCLPLSAAMEKARIRFEESPDLTRSGTTVHFSTAVHQQHGDWLVLNAGDFSVYEPTKNDARLRFSPEYSGGCAMIDARHLAFSFSLSTPGKYQVWMHASFPRRANYNHAEKMDDGLVRTISDSKNPAVANKFANSGATEAIHPSHYLAPGRWHWVANFQYQLDQGKHLWQWPSPNAWCGGCLFDRIVLIRSESALRPEQACLDNRRLIRPQTGLMMSRRIKIERIARWQFNYAAAPGNGSISVEYSYGGKEWLPLQSETPYSTDGIPADTYLFLRMKFKDAPSGGIPPILYHYSFTVDKKKKVR